MQQTTNKTELMFPTTPYSRVYVHHTGCKQATGIDGSHFQRLCDPMSGADQTFCAGCGGIFYEQHFLWEDTQELVSDYRKRMLQYTPPQVKQWYQSRFWIAGIILGIVITAILYVLLPARQDQTPQERWMLLGIMSAVMLVISCALSWSIGGIIVRKRYPFDYRRMR